MENNVTSVDLDEIRKLREEMARENGSVLPSQTEEAEMPAESVVVSNSFDEQKNEESLESLIQSNETISNENVDETYSAEEIDITKNEIKNISIDFEEYDKLIDDIKQMVVEIEDEDKKLEEEESLNQIISEAESFDINKFDNLLDEVDKILDEEDFGEENKQSSVDNKNKIAETNNVYIFEKDIEFDESIKIKLKPIEPYNFVDTISSEKFKNSDRLSYIIGKDEDGIIHYGNLRDFYNMVVFGKETIYLNNLIHSILLSLILKNPVSAMNFVICDTIADSKLVVYNKSSHMYFNRVAKTSKEILTTLQNLESELNERYKLFVKLGEKTIENYNMYAEKKGVQPLPYIVTIINNYSKLNGLVGLDKINELLHKILKLGRIVGMYIILVSNGEIESKEINYSLPTRIAFNTDSEISSLNAIGYSGAEDIESADEFLCSTIQAKDVLHLKVPNISLSQVSLIIEKIEE